MDIFDIQSVKEQEIASRVQAGETIVYPTETCYGLGADALNPKAVDAVFAIKQRQKEKTVLVLMADIAMALQYVHWSDDAQRLADLYWPGPPTMVLTAQNPTQFPEGIVAKDGTMAIRITKHPVAQAIVLALGSPLVSTSANISSQDSPYDEKAVEEMIIQSDLQPDMFIHAGDLPHHAPSTIVAIVDGKIKIIRQGDIIIE